MIDLIGDIVEIAFEAIGLFSINEDAKKQKTKRHIVKAAEIIQHGGLVAFPTETVYGLGADAFNAQAVERIYAAKGRPGDNPLILHIANTEQFIELTESLPHYAMLLVSAFWPGPLTLIAKKKYHLPSWVGGHPNKSTDTIGVRMPSHPIAQAFLKIVGCPVAAPSANKSGRPSPTKSKHVKEDFAKCDEVNMILDGAESDIGIESTVVDVTGAQPVILRPGAITEEMILEVTGLEVSDSNTKNSDAPRSPGMKYRHYAPKAPMFILSGKSDDVAKYIASEAKTAFNQEIGLLITKQTESFLTKQSLQNIKIITLSHDPAEIAKNLFAALRRFDKMGIAQIYAEAAPNIGIGIAIMDRMLKAAEGNIIHVEFPKN